MFCSCRRWGLGGLLGVPVPDGVLDGPLQHELLAVAAALLQLDILDDCGIGGLELPELVGLVGEGEVQVALLGF